MEYWRAEKTIQKLGPGPQIGRETQRKGGTNMMQSQRLTRGALVLALTLAAAALPPRMLRAEEPDAYSEDKIKAFIADLGNEDFAKRQTAEKELAKAGAKAQKQLDAVKDSPDAQVKTTVTHLLAKLKFAALPPVDYLELLPAKSLVVIRGSNIGSFVENARKSAIGRLCDNPAMDPFKKKIKELSEKKPEVAKTTELWTKRFSGQVAAAILEINPALQDVKMAVIAEVTDPDPGMVYSELVNEIHLADNAQPGNYGDVDYIEGQNAQGAAALVGKHVILANNLGALKVMIDAFTTPGKFAASDNFTKIKPSLGAKPELLLTVDMEALIAIVKQLPIPIPIDDILVTSGLKNLKFVGFTSSIAGDSFEDRLVETLVGPMAGIYAANIPPTGVAPLNAAALAPQNAVALGTIYIDGAKFHAGMVEYFASMRKMKETLQNLGGGMPPENDDPETQIKKFEENTGLKVADLAADIKGEFAQWVVPATGAIPGPPDVGGVITCESPEKATALSDAFAKIANTGKDKPVVIENPYKNRLIRQLDVETMFPNRRKDVPYVPSWTVDGNHVFLGSSPAVLQKQITSIDTKAPGLLTQQDFVKAIGTLSEDERKGSMLYVDAKTLLTMGATIGLPLLQVQSKDEDLKKALAALPPSAELFKDIPPLVGCNVVNGNENKFVLRAAVPPLPTLFVALIGATVAKNWELLGLGDGGGQGDATKNEAGEAPGK